eukprot:2124855-Lingulodinium_polyedra.AAC.1
MRSNRPSAVATAHNKLCCTHGVRERATRGGRPVETAWALLTGAACVLRGSCLGTPWELVLP